MIDDTPLTSSERDRLGFGEIARQLALAFLQNDLRLGFVVGVEGAWGSGKSSLVNMALNEFSIKRDGPHVVRFAPWLVGSRNEMLIQFFAQLESGILKETLPCKQEDMKKLLGRYAKGLKGLQGLANLAEFAEMVEIPLASQLKKLLKWVSRKADEYSKESLVDIKNRLREELKQLDRPILIFVDDLDRLEPCEVMEVLRLVKAVADFPNVAYILAYDPKIIANSIQRALRVPDGRSYLEKVIQASFKVPSPMSFDLRNFLKEEISLLLKKVSLSESAKERLDNVYHQWGSEYLETPRDVVRVLNFMKLNFIPVQHQVDPGDMLFLQIIRIKDKSLFDWIERYASILSAGRDKEFLAGVTHESVGKQILELLEHSEKKEKEKFIYALSKHLPRLNNCYQNFKEDIFTFSSISDANELLKLNSEKRLVSPSHFKLYFSLSAPSGYISDDEVQQFLSDCEYCSDEAVSRFRELIREQRPQGGNVTEVLLYQISVTKVLVSQVEGLFQVLGEVIDELISYSEESLGDPSFLESERKNIFKLIYTIEDPYKRSDILQKLFSKAKSLSWLSEIIRSSTAAHGASDNKNIPKEQWSLSEEEYNMIAELFVQRLSATEPENLLNAPNFLSLMYAWYQLGDTEAGAVREWIKNQSESDEEFIDLLNKMTSWGYSSSVGVEYTLRPETIENFFGGKNTVKERLTRVIQENAVGQDRIEVAREYLAEINVWASTHGETDSA